MDLVDDLLRIAAKGFEGGEELAYNMKRNEQRQRRLRNFAMF